jgi:hypothetical protein
VSWLDAAAAQSHSEGSFGVGYSILLGVVSGLLSTLLTWLGYKFSTDTVVPWYQRQLYRGVLIDGTWKGQRQDIDTLYGFSLHLTQNGHHLKGTFTAENRRENESDTSKTFVLDGEITDDCVLLRYTPLDRHTYGSGAFLCQVFDGGRVLKGGMLYFKTRVRQIGSVHDLELQRTI